MRRVVLSMLLLLAVAPVAHGQEACTTTGPNVIVGSLPNVNSYGSVGNIAAFSVGTTSCNIGCDPLSWVASTNQHPVIAQDMFRLKDGVMEHIGMSWLKHGFAALSGSVCGTCTGGGGSALQPGCSDPYSAGLNGSQGNGPRFDINATSTFFPYPHSEPAPAAGTIGRRLQVHHDDLNPALNPGAQYFVTGNYIAPGEQGFPGNDDNNISYRAINVSPSGGSYNITLTGSTVRQSTALDAWQAEIPEVEIQTVHVDGLIQIATHVIDLGGLWQYEYAIFNANSDRSVGEFTVVLNGGTVLTSTGFHDVDYHSGEPYTNASWATTVSGTDVNWATESFAANEDANALRWGALYNFRFVSTSAPSPGSAVISMFKPGTPDSVTINVPVPSGTGGGTAPVSDLACSTTGVDTVDLSWSNNGPYTGIEITRDGSVIAMLSGSTTSYSDSPVALGAHTYGVTAMNGGSTSFTQTCGVSVEADGVSDVACNQVGSGSSVSLSWTNNDPYGSVEVRRGGSVIAVLTGASTTYLDSPVLAGSYTYSVEGLVGAAGTGAVECDVTVLPPPPPTLLFSFEAGDATVTYDPSTGAGSGSSMLTAVELGSSPGYPNAIGGWSMAVGFDASLVSVSGVDQPAGLSGVDFYQATVWSGGVTIGIIESFLGLTTDLAVSTETGVIQLDTVASTFIGDAVGTTSSLIFEDDQHGNPGFEIDNVVAADGVTHNATVSHASVQIVPGVATGLFVRGDANGDSGIDIADPIFILAELFSMGPSSNCDDASDANDDGGKDIGDPIYLLDNLFSSGPNPPSPYPACGADPSVDGLDCASFTPCD